jgi:hypothetical protein
MGEVFLGRHLTTGLDVAVKLIKTTVASRERFLNEARLGLAISDPHLVRVYNAGEEQEQLFIVMEVLSGGTVKDHLRAQRIPWERAVDWLLQAARGLSALHKAGVIHRDIKPSNMMFNNSGALKLTDFGLARRCEEGGVITRSSDRLGSPAYIAPEQVLDPSDADERSDIYSLGISFYEMLTGCPPFRTPSETDVCFLQVHKQLPDVRTLAPDLPIKLVHLLQRMTAKDPHQRPANGEELVADLERLCSSGTRSTLVRMRPQRQTTAWIAAGFALMLIALPGYQFLERPQATTTVTWQTPQRAVFMLPQLLDAQTTLALQSGLAATGLNVVERAQVDRLLEGPDFTALERTNPHTAVRVGQLVGGHIALFAQPMDGWLALRTVEVETTLLRGSEMIPLNVTADQVRELILNTAKILPAQGEVMTFTTPARCFVSLGKLRGVSVGNRFQLFRDKTDYPTKPLTQGVIVETAPTTATLLLDQPQTVPVGALVERVIDL